MVYRFVAKTVFMPSIGLEIYQIDFDPGFAPDPTGGGALCPLPKNPTAPRP